MKSLIKFIPILLLGCTTTQKIIRPNNVTEYIIACGTSVGFNVCYEKANELCSSGYTTISEKVGVNRKELKIECPDAKSKIGLDSNSNPK